MDDEILKASKNYRSRRWGEFRLLMSQIRRIWGVESTFDDKTHHNLLRILLKSIERPYPWQIFRAKKWGGADVVCPFVLNSFTHSLGQLRSDWVGLVELTLVQSHLEFDPLPVFWKAFLSESYFDSSHAVIGCDSWKSLLERLSCAAKAAIWLDSPQLVWAHRVYVAI